MLKVIVVCIAIIYCHVNVSPRSVSEHIPILQITRDITAKTSKN